MTPNGVYLGYVFDIDHQGRFVSFVSYGSNLSSSDPNGVISDAFVADTKAGAIELVSVDVNGQGTNQASMTAVISADGHVIAFASEATDPVSTPTNHKRPIYVAESR